MEKDGNGGIRVSQETIDSFNADMKEAMRRIMLQEAASLKLAEEIILTD